jgi:hypothetical protein
VIAVLEAGMLGAQELCCVGRERAADVDHVYVEIFKLGCMFSKQGLTHS